jgi:hypothetical protein
VYRSGWSDCGGCSSGCGGCGGCGSSYSSGGVVVERAAPGAVYMPQQPATVNKPSESTTVPRLQPDTMMQTPAGVGTESMPGVPRTTTPDMFDPGTGGPASTGTPTAPVRGGTTPAGTPTETKSGADPLEGLFPTGTGTRGGATTPPATTPTTPATTPPTGFDDLFREMPPAGAGGAPTTPAAGGAPPAGGGATPTGGATPAGGATDTKSADPLEGLFGTPTGGGATTPPASGGATPDPFKSSAILREEGGLASDQNREWVDNTGRYATRGRLVSFLDGHVRLLKDNGRTTTVPLARLSENDLEFVNRQASAQRAIQVAERAASEVGTPLAAN